MNGISVKEQEVLLEMENLICQIIELMHRVLDIEERQGLLSDAQHEKIFSDVNCYDDMRAEIIIRNKKQVSQKNESANSSVAVLNENLLGIGSMGRQKRIDMKMF